MNEDLERIIAALQPQRCSAVEVAGHLRSHYPWANYTALDYPDFDLCVSIPTRQFDVVVCEQVLEHVPDPIHATRTLYALCKPGATLIVSTPFLVRVHREPTDFWRYTPAGLERLLGHVGFADIDVKAWGNPRCVSGNLRHWAKHRPWQSLRNVSDVPCVVWATARRPHIGGVPEWTWRAQPVTNCSDSSHVP
jgi:SAM-dependent methyltransferase